MFCGGGISERPRLDAVEDTLLAEIGLDRVGLKAAEQVGIVLFQLRPFRARRVGAAHRPELDLYRAGFRRRCRVDRWRRSTRCGRDVRLWRNEARLFVRTRLRLRTRL